MIALWWTMLLVGLNADREYAQARAWERAHARVSTVATPRSR